MLTEPEQDIIRQIEQAALGSEPISSSLVRDWMSSGSLEVQGALTHLLEEHSERVRPSLSWEEVCSVFRNYYRGCLIQDVRKSDYVPNRHIAGYELVNWFKYLWRERSAPREELQYLKGMLTDLYLSNERLRDAIVNAVLEHLFETAEIAEYFSDSKSDPVLKTAYDLAEEWAKDHRSSS